jgi:hypothetical protein
VSLGGFQPVQVLLAVLVGDPAVASAVFTTIRDADPTAELVDVIAGDARCTRLAHLLDEIKRRAPADSRALDLSAFKTWGPRLTRYSFHSLGLETTDMDE